MSESWRQVVDSDNQANWKVTDIAQLGARPRELSEAAKKYVTRTTRSGAATLVILFGVFSLLGGVMMLAVVGPNANAIGTVVVTLAVVVLVVRVRNQQRERLRTVIRDGDLRMAMLHDTAQISVGRGLARKYKYVSVFSIEGKPVKLVSWDDGMSMLQVGTPAEVVWHPEHPDLIVPT
ncbi:MAG: hypothetical protein JO257_29620, partial [Deltaproteobacteria bacterium]|nr:hypothetical protein [Deltaproteobacteria bacterium]